MFYNTNYSDKKYITPYLTKLYLDNYKRISCWFRVQFENKGKTVYNWYFKMVKMNKIIKLDYL